MPVSEYDAYVNLAGGIRQTEPALDLGIALAILSSYRNRAIDDTILAFGEIGLSGEIRAVSMAEQRVQEAAKMGFKTCILPKSCLKNVKNAGGIRLIGVAGMKEVLEVLE